MTISCPQMSGNDPNHPTPAELSEHELEQEKASRDAAEESESEEEARANLRRADKAHYLREKLEQQARADKESDR